tara:strand:- start:2353 stop:2829 length:477 start_codon:yes stop_codon:yes gene_type:complete
MPPQNNNSKDYDRHDIKKDIDNMDINSNEDVLRIQKRLNTFLSIDNPDAMKHFKAGYSPYEQKDFLPLDGMYGKHTRQRIGKFLRLSNKLTSDSVFQALEGQRTDYDLQTPFNTYNREQPADPKSLRDIGHMQSKDDTDQWEHGHIHGDEQSQIDKNY